MMTKFIYRFRKRKNDNYPLFNWAAGGLEIGFLLDLPSGACTTPTGAYWDITFPVDLGANTWIGPSCGLNATLWWQLVQW